MGSVKELDVSENTFRRLRHRLGLTEVQLADALKLTQSCVSHWEVIGTIPRARSIEKYVAYLEVHAPELVSWLDSYLRGWNHG